MSKDSLIFLRDAYIFNDDNLVLQEVNIEIEKGELVYLIGKVGSGKSSIIKTFIAELPLKKGEGKVGEFNLVKLKKRKIPYLRRKCGVVFQDFQLLMDRSVLDNLLFVLEATGWSKKKVMTERAMEVLKLVGMDTKSHKMPHQLSGGEQQRVAIARAMLNNPDIILADEPTGNHDPETAIGIMELLMKIHKDYNPTVVMVTHNRDLLKKSPGRVFNCEDGYCKESINEMEEMNLSELMC